METPSPPSVEGRVRRSRLAGLRSDLHGSALKKPLRVRSGPVGFSNGSWMSLEGEWSSEQKGVLLPRWIRPAIARTRRGEQARAAGLPKSGEIVSSGSAIKAGPS